MQAKLTFLGAAKNVTGSQFLLEANGTRLLIDCGMYQERQFLDRNWAKFSFPPAKLDAVLLTHAHLDHCGRLPRLVKEGFAGPIHCTAATAEIAKIVLEDAAHIQEEDASYKAKRHSRERRRGPYIEAPLYTVEDAIACGKHFRGTRYEHLIKVAKGVEVSFHDAGHILGAAMIQVHLTDGRERRTIIFSGDVGRWHTPILQDPTVFRQADYVVVESTYGDRLHEPQAEIPDRLARIVTDTWKAGGNLCIPSFALERSQEVLYHLNSLLMADRIPHLMVMMDSPMAISVTEVFQNHRDLFDEQMTLLESLGNSPFDLPGLTMTRSVRESKAINHIKGTVIIIAGAGMCTGGRIKHHLVANISRPESTILFVGYQAVGTLGRMISDGAEEVRILGETFPVKARVEQLFGFSAHAERDELMYWLSGLEAPPRKTFIVHGDDGASERFAEHLRTANGWDTIVPAYEQQVELD